MATIFHRPTLQPVLHPALPEKKRVPQLQRVKKEHLPSFRLTARDIAIVEQVYIYKALATEHIAALFFPPATVKGKEQIQSNCVHRLKLLFHHGFLLRAEQPQRLSDGRKPYVYWVDKRGITDIIAPNRGVDVAALGWNPTAHKVGLQFLSHLLDTNTVRVALTLAAKRSGVQVTDWRDEPTLRKDHAGDTVTIRGNLGETHKTTVFPDDYFLLEQPPSEDTGARVWRLFFEIDRRTVTGETNTSAQSQRDWAQKIRAHLAYFHSYKYQKRYGTKSGMVLTVTTGQERADNLKAITEKVGGKSRFWFTTLDQVKRHNVLAAPIWSVASRHGGYSLIEPVHI